MNWLEVIVQVVVTLAGVVGGSFGIIYWRENKRLKQEEVEGKKIENELKQAEAWQKLFEEEHENSIKKLVEKSERLRGLYAERDGLKEEVNKLTFKVQQLQWFHCTVNGCHRRRPPHVFDDEGNENTALEHTNECHLCGSDCENKENVEPKDE